MWGINHPILEMFMSKNAETTNRTALKWMNHTIKLAKHGNLSIKSWWFHQTHQANFPIMIVLSPEGQLNPLWRGEDPTISHRVDDDSKNHH